MAAPERTHFAGPTARASTAELEPPTGEDLLRELELIAGMLRVEARLLDQAAANFRAGNPLRLPACLALLLPDLWAHHQELQEKLNVLAEWSEIETKETLPR